MVSGSTLLRQKGLRSYAENREIDLCLTNYSCDDVEILVKLEKESCALATDLSVCMQFYFSPAGKPSFLAENLSKAYLVMSFLHEPRLYRMV